MQDTEIRLSVISFTSAGMQLSRRVKTVLSEGTEVQLYTKCKACGEGHGELPVSTVDTSVAEWAGRQMRERNAMLFIGACGIAVRAVASCLSDKMQDAPVLVMDERGSYVIPILSGHMGGANELAGILAKKLGAQAVITTATDLNHKFAVDLFAKENGFSIADKDGISKISAKELAGDEVTVSIETGHGCGIFVKSGMREVPYPPTGFTDLVITSEETLFDTAMVLRPKEYILGLGCKKGKGADEIGQFVTAKLKENGILTTQIFALASISQKKEEAGIREWCRKEGVRFLTYTAKQLQELEGDFTKSAFVMEQVGVDNVCERAALKACGAGGELIAKKCAEHGMTLAIAKRKWRVCLDET